VRRINEAKTQKARAQEKINKKKASVLTRVMRGITESPVKLLKSAEGRQSYPPRKNTPPILPHLSDKKKPQAKRRRPGPTTSASHIKQNPPRERRREELLGEDLDQKRKGRTGG